MTDKMDAVARNKVIEESIRREQRSLKLATEYRVADARKMTILPEKPNYTTPAQQPSEQELQAAHDKLASLTCIRHIGCSPAQAYALPITGNMEYGFTASPLVRQDPMFQHFKGSCDVTRYAAAFASMKGVAPFHSSGGAAAAGKAKK